MTKCCRYYTVLYAYTTRKVTMSIEFFWSLFVFTWNMQVYFSHFIWLLLALDMNILLVWFIMI